MTKVSIITLSHFNRINFLKVLAKCIKKQDYDKNKIIEWIIVDTSANCYFPSDENLEKTIKEFQEDPLLPKIIYHITNKKIIGAWRNEANNLVTGDIVVCMDDDDYYPPCRISYVVEKLQDKKSLIAGCDKILFFDIHFNKFYQFNGFSLNHSTNNCMAYWKEYLSNHSYDEISLYAEENSFTNNFAEPLVQMDPYKTVLQFSHDSNTYNKKSIIYQNYFLDDKMKYITEINSTIKDFINDDEIYNDYLNIFNELKKPNESVYDIVYFTGGFSIEWSPIQNNLGGSEQAVKHLCAEWVKKGKKVAVFGNTKVEGKFDGVDYFNYLKFRFWDKYKTLILWRLYGSYPYIYFDLLADKLLVDVHDHQPEYYLLLWQNKTKIAHWMFRSEFQHQLVQETLGQKIENAIIIPNGIRITDFSKNTKESRNQFRMCYCSCYTRGLVRILKNIWPIIYSLEQRAELHIYYGMDLVMDEKFKNEIKELLSQPGIMEHGRQPIEIINREKHMSVFHFYYTDSLSEIDCITIKESLVAGCLPVISDIHLFKYRDGIHLKWLPNTDDYNRQIACTIVEMMHNEQLQNQLRDIYLKSKTIISWEDVANAWIDYM